jgi:replicative DNA helicase
MRSQRLKVAVIEAGERYQQGGNDLAQDVEQILHKALRLKQDPMDSGTFLSDKKRILGYLNNPVHAIALGIPELDRRGIGPTPGEMLAFMAPKGRGKTWFCIHAGVMALLQGLKVAHITLEMGDPRIMPRYLQRLFAVAKRNEEFEITTFVQDKKHVITDFNRETRKPELYFSDPRISRKLGLKMDEWGDRFGRLVVKTFPSGMLTMGQLEAYLDGLEASHKFVPDMLIIDYPDLMQIDDRQDHRIALGRLYVDLRGVMGARNLAGIVPIQTNRKGESARLVTAELTGEDYSKTQTSDIVLTYNQTPMEKDLSLARLFVDKGRNDEDKFSVLIAQNYVTGQFVTQSAFMPHQHYWKLVKSAAGVEETED